ncbi:hypothetical protein RQM47_09290 [Rubrivirga sp. S365]|uniref:7-cyano-7-deazaguanine synthase n=1 Tax=Rubrivirga litoralis TaxID=3075598 RepID=A0ABU3BSG0_9BACT|nr:MULTISPECIES: hypothetical protein [unclassified Rubrivirga]MDT0632223.1 hypothetical protein [Rubrivirga sp. F394]MDT7856833.1 hypothetical protein [Rubrivirga sp. S365]
MPPFNPTHLNDLSPQDDLTLWTGGWDSTYRVLQRALLEETPVRPVYVVDRNRGSAHMELGAMNGLLLALERRYPEAYARIEPPRYVDLRAVPPDPEITDAWRTLREDHSIGTQYDWLPRLAKAADWTGVELSIYGGGRLRPMFGDSVGRVEGPGGPTYALSDDAPEPVQVLFGRFAFPLWDTTKAAAFEAAEAAGLSPLLDAHTWFCFKPRNGKPCGGCRPCQFMVKDGLGHRVPAVNRVRARAERAVNRARSRAKVGTKLRALRDRATR